MRPIHPLLRVFLILSVIFVVLALARGWFYVSKPNDADKNKVNVQFTVDTAKVKEDSAKVKQAAEELGEKVSGEAKQLQNKVSDHEPVPPAPLEKPAVTPVPNNAAPDNQVQNPPNSVVK